MAINKKLREQVKMKFNGLCAYTGNPLGDDWQIDHIFPKHRKFGVNEKGCYLINHDHIDNLVPAIRRINHYKRGEDLEGFRAYMSNFHLRLAKLPKKTSLKSTENRIEYMNDIANLFGITIDNPFSGKFYFETISKSLFKYEIECVYRFGNFDKEFLTTTVIAESDEIAEQFAKIVRRNIFKTVIKSKEPYVEPRL